MESAVSEETGSRVPTSVDKALDVCEALGREPSGMSVSELARALKLPRPTAHRLLAVLKRRGYVRQDEETQKYSLGGRMLDLCFQLLGRSELRLHAYPMLRDYAVQSGLRGFLAVPARSEVTYVWATGSDEAAMRTAYGREMPAHCSCYFDPASATRRLSCLRLSDGRDVGRSDEAIRHVGPDEDGAQRLFCCCAPVCDYSGREVARVGVFGHGPSDRPILGVHNRGAWELARHVSMRLGNLSAVTAGIG